MSQFVLVDLETRSACSLKGRGGFTYAADPTTRLLTVAWQYEGQDSLWFPGAESIPESYQTVHLPGVAVHTGRAVPEALLALLDKTWVAHNADGFDSLVWAACTGRPPAAWADTMPRAASIGLPMGLNAIGKVLWGEGKYEEGQAALKKGYTATGISDCDPENVPIGQQVLIGRYCAQDVRLLAALWETLQREYRAPEAEKAVLAAHVAINARGARVDRGLVHALIALDSAARGDAVARIRTLTGGRLDGEKALRSRPAVFAWLDHMGVRLGTSLRKNIVDRWIAEHREEETDSEEEDAPKDLATVVQVLELRSAALRITGGKLDAALHAMCDDDYVRGLHVYHAAHSGRWAGRRIQTQNLPRPKPGVDTWALIALYERDKRLDLDAVSAMCDPNDAASALLRSIFLPDEGCLLADADLAGIEARVLAWLAGEQWLMDMYWSGGDPYIKMAETLCGPKERWPIERTGKYPDGMPPGKHSYRQQLGKVPYLGAGYQMGAAKLTLTALNYGINLEAFDTNGQTVITAYRRTHPAIAGTEAGEYNGRPYFKGGIWDRLDAAAVAAVEGRPGSVGPVSFCLEGPHLTMGLPSGRRFIYRDARIVERQFYRRVTKAVSYTHPRYGRKANPQYGGAWTENVVQAIARDVIAHGIRRCEEEGLGSCLHVHDSAASSLRIDARVEQFDLFMRCISTPPEWLTQFPLDAEGGMAPRWAKDAHPDYPLQVYRNGVRHK